MFSKGIKIEKSYPSNYGGLVTEWYIVMVDEGSDWVKAICWSDLAVRSVRKTKLLRMIAEGANVSYTDFV